MKVNEAIEMLMELPLEADLLICGHEFPDMQESGNVGWHILHFEPSHDGSTVLIEGAGPLDGEA